MLPEKMRRLLTGLAKAVAKNINEAVTPLEVRITTLEAAAGIASKAAPTMTRVPEHAVGEIVTYGATRFKCVAPNRYRAIEDEDRAA